MKTTVGVLVAIVVIGGGIFLFAQHQAPGAAAVTATQSASPTSAPDFSLPKVGGGTIALADYKSKEPVILDFWATWCPNCQRDIPHLNAYYQKYKDKVQVIGIDLQEDPSVVARFVSDNAANMTYPVANDPGSAIANAYNIQGTNTHVLIDKNGNIVKVIPGDISESDFQSLIGS